eukprot:CAMPEP_0170550350 /NCGR_PEP_ID=MMETSP0211-20121228/8415_1 /TAXON_ID=311385 /ORGANISM="Pseudokeronopsis sp., Strain OXSARD2" /LENGTH=100 /DNA_ID=CAMNT_0010856853 /DNA_START=82 /DNA_END=384 /DNA_ORIENTATION=-
MSRDLNGRLILFVDPQGLLDILRVDYWDQPQYDVQIFFIVSLVVVSFVLAGRFQVLARVGRGSNLYLADQLREDGVQEWQVNISIGVCELQDDLFEDFEV